jgi:hypothetical protein
MRFVSRTQIALSSGCLALLVLILATARAADDAKTFAPDDEGFIRNWLVLDPIPLGDTAGNHEEESQKPFFAKEHFTGQKDVQPKDGDKAKVGEKQLAWHAVKCDDFYVDFEKSASDANKEKENSLFFAVAYVIADKDTDGLKLAIGSDDSSVWTLNGKELIRVYEGRPVDKDQNTAEGVALKKGVNVLRAMVINGEGPTGACARFLDKEGKPVKGLKVAVAPGDPK